VDFAISGATAPSPDRPSNLLVPSAGFTATGKQLMVLRGHADYVTSSAFSPDGKRIVTASRDNTA
jgi:WD40 repeat protein